MKFHSHRHLHHPYIKWPAPVGLRPRAAAPWRVLDLCKAYDFPTSAPGGGVIGIVELAGGWLQDDLDKFTELNGISQRIVVKDVSADGTSNHSNPDPNADGEVALDIQVAAAAYYAATGTMPKIKVIWAKDIAPAVRKAVSPDPDDDYGPCDVCSISWGNDEIRWAQIPGSAQDMENAAADATQKGCIVFAASGDNSSGDNDPGANVDLPSACPHVVGCGGTSKTKFSEVVWGSGQTDGQGTGGGYSNVFPPQSWQIGIPPGTGRMVPDVAANADPNTGYMIVVNGHEIQIGGTSAVAPLYSGLFAAFGKQLGFVTPRLYQHPEAFYDITQGSNGAYSASVGPDPCTGLGAPNGAALWGLFGGPPSAARAQIVCQPCAVGPSASGLIAQSSSAQQQFPSLANAQHLKILQVSPAEMVATGVTNVTPDSITLHLEGSIGAIPYNFDLIFALDLANDQLIVTLRMTQPVAYEGSWTFKLHRTALAASPAGTAAYTTASLAAASLPGLGGGIVGCIIKCVGPELVSIVVECLPSLIGGKEAFFACLIQRAGASFPKIVQCVQQCK